jgi:hypothetical protein
MRALVPAAFLVLLASCDQHPSGDAENGSEQELLSLELSVREDGTASPVWTEGIAIAIGEEAAEAFARESIPLSPHAEAWLGVLEAALPRIEVRAAEVAALFDVPLMNALVVVGNRGSSDGFGWAPDYIGINVQAFAETYGPPDEDAPDRMVRIVAHEYLHLLTYAFYPNHRELRQTPLDRALWTIYFEGIGDYVSVSRRWHPDGQGKYSQVTDDTLRKLEPIFVERLEKLATATDADEKELRAGITMGKFDRKWGSLTFALWLHSEAKRCGEEQTLRAVIRMERDSVLPLALRYAAPGLQTRLEALQGVAGREHSESGCLGTVYRPK